MLSQHLMNFSEAKFRIYEKTFFLRLEDSSRQREKSLTTELLARWRFIRPGSLWRISGKAASFFSFYSHGVEKCVRSFIGASI